MYKGDVCTVNVNMAGLPAVVLPCGFAEQVGARAHTHTHTHTHLRACAHDYASVCACWHVFCVREGASGCPSLLLFLTRQSMCVLSSAALRRGLCAGSCACVCVCSCVHAHMFPVTMSGRWFKFVYACARTHPGLRHIALCVWTCCEAYA